MIVRALLADLDGTLVDTFPDLLAAAEVALTGAGVALRREAIDAARRDAGAGAAAILAHLSGVAQVPQSWVDRMVEWYRQHPAERGAPFPGTAAWLTDFTVAVVTNKPRTLAEPILRHWYGAAAPLLVTPDDAGVGKPDPRPVTLALSRLGVAAADAAFVGDDPRDYHAARGAGVSFVLAAYGYTTAADWRDLPSLPAVATAADLPRLLKGTLA